VSTTRCLILLFCALIVFSVHSVVTADDVTELATINPQVVGFSPEKLDTVRQFLEANGSAAFLGLYDGKIFFSWGEIHEKYPVHSIRKPLLGALYGIYLESGKLDSNKTLRELNIDDIPPELTDKEKEVRVIELLQSRSGIYHQAAGETQTMIETRPKRGAHAPGTFFYYNNWDFNALGTIFEQEVGTKIYDAFHEKIAQPLGMRDFVPVDGFYQYEKEKSLHPAYHVRMTAYDLALFGLLCQKRGLWNGKQIIPSEWVTKSTTAYSVASPELGLGYGYMWNVLLGDRTETGGGFLHTGAGVHMLAVFPDFNLVLVHRVETEEPYDFTTGHLIRLLDLVFAAMQ